MMYFDTSLSLADPFPIEIVFQKLITAALVQQWCKAD